MSTPNTIAPDTVALARPMLERVALALHNAGVLCDAVPTRLQNNAEPSIALIGSLVNEQGIYGQVRDAHDELSAALAAPTADNQNCRSVQKRLAVQQPAASGAGPVAWRYRQILPDGSVMPGYWLIHAPGGMDAASAERGVVAEPLYTGAQAAPQPLHITVLTDWLAARYRAAGGKQGITDVSAWAEEVMRWTEEKHGIGAALAAATAAQPAQQPADDGEWWEQSSPAPKASDSQDGWQQVPKRLTEAQEEVALGVAGLDCIEADRLWTALLEVAPAAGATAPTDADVQAAIDQAKGSLREASEALFGPAAGATGAEQ